MSGRSDEGALVRIIEIDTYTGAERVIPTYMEPSGLWLRADAEESVAWRRKNIVARYDYRIEEAAANPKGSTP